MSRRAYPEYRPSGVEWLGDIPDNWQVVRLKHNSYIKGRIGWQNLRAEEFTDEGPYLVTGMHFRAGTVDWDSCYHITEERYLMAPEIFVKSGDVLITKDGSIGKVAYIDTPPGPTSLNSHLLLIRPQKALDYRSRYLYYLLASEIFQRYARMECSGTTFDGISQEAVSNFHMTIPVPDEQSAIVAFLDRETARIDALIEKKQRQIELLQEKRAALISHAVTKGLNPDAPMKDTGIEWLGKIPEHWDVLRIKHVARMESGHTPDRKVEEYWTNCFIPWVSLNDTSYLIDHDYIDDTTYHVNELGLANSSARLLPEKAVVFTRDATIGLSAIMTRPMAVSQHIIAWLCGPRITPEYLLRVLYSMTKELDRLTMGATIKTLGMPNVLELVTPLPPLEEQKRIVEAIERAVPKIDTLSAKVRGSIEKLHEYRTALISAAVTGKIDVRKEVS